MADKLQSRRSPLSQPKTILSFLTPFAPFLAVAVLGITTSTGQPYAQATRAQTTAPWSVRLEDFPDQYAPHLAPTCALILRGQHRAVLMSRAKLQHPLSPSERMWALRSYAENVSIYNGIAGRVPPAAFSGSSLPRFISLSPQAISRLNSPSHSSTI